MPLYTYELKLVPSTDIPQFKTLRSALVRVSLRDIFTTGVHPGMYAVDDPPFPESTCYLTQNSDGAVTCIREALNSEDALVAIGKPTLTGSTRQVTLASLDDLSNKVFFTEPLAYAEFVQIAVQKLRDTWDDEIARSFVTDEGGCRFSDIRTFLKSIDPSISLRGYSDLTYLEFSKMVSVDNFLTEDLLLLRQGLKRSSFRTCASLQTITDEAGRLRLTPRIDTCVVSVVPNASAAAGAVSPVFTYECSVDKGVVRWRPNITTSIVQRQLAKKIARSLGKGSGRYCFTTTIEDMEVALEMQPMLRIGFPALRYDKAGPTRVARSAVESGGVPLYTIGHTRSDQDTNESIQHVLSSFNYKISGTKPVLLERIALLLSDEYDKQLPHLDRYFAEHRFIRLPKGGTMHIQSFPVLSSHPLQNELLTLYCLRHSRGNTILEASHHNTTVPVKDLALAMLEKRVTLGGCFVDVVA